MQALLKCRKNVTQNFQIYLNHLSKLKNTVDIDLRILRIFKQKNRSNYPMKNTEN